MISRIDLRATLQRSSDRAELQTYLQQLVGQPFLFLQFSYGDELTLHFGRLGQSSSTSSSSLARLSKGSYIIGARASSWFVTAQMSPYLLVARSQPASRAQKHFTQVTPEQLEASEFLRPGKRIVAVNTSTLGTRTRSAYAFGLSVLLEDDAALSILPSATSKRHHRKHEVADWEIFTPYERYFAVGPGARWSYLPSRTASQTSA